MTFSDKIGDDINKHYVQILYNEVCHHLGDQYDSELRFSKWHSVDV